MHWQRTLDVIDSFSAYSIPAVRGGKT